MAAEPSVREMYQNRAVPASAEESRILREAIAGARRLGLSWCAPVEIWMFRGEAEENAGATVRGSRPITIFIQSNLSPATLREIALHELSHAADEANPDHNRLEGEQRAVQFARRAMRVLGWRQLEPLAELRAPGAR